MKSIISILLSLVITVPVYSQYIQDDIDTSIKRGTLTLLNKSDAAIIVEIPRLKIEEMIQPGKASSKLLADLLYKNGESWCISYPHSKWKTCSENPTPNQSPFLTVGDYVLIFEYYGTKGGWRTTTLKLADSELAKTQ